MTPGEEVQNLTAIVGGLGCNAVCPYCVSKQTPTGGVTVEAPEVDWVSFEDAAVAGLAWGAKTVLLTGKGEPTLFPEQLTEYLEFLYQDLHMEYKISYLPVVARQIFDLFLLVDT